MPNTDEMKNKAAQAAQGLQDQDMLDETEQQDESTQSPAGGKMDDIKKKMDRTGDDDFDMEDVKKMGEDAVNKVKGMFKKD